MVFPPKIGKTHGQEMMNDGWQEPEKGKPIILMKRHPNTSAIIGVGCDAPGAKAGQEMVLAKYNYKLHTTKQKNIK